MLEFLNKLKNFLIPSLRKPKMLDGELCPGIPKQTNVWSNYYIHSVYSTDEVASDNIHLFIERLQSILATGAILSESLRKKNSIPFNSLQNFLNGTDYVSVTDTSLCGMHAGTFKRCNLHGISFLISRDIENHLQMQDYDMYDGKKRPLMFGEIHVKDSIPTDFFEGILMPNNTELVKQVYSSIGSSLPIYDVETGQKLGVSWKESIQSDLSLEQQNTYVESSLENSEKRLESKETNEVNEITF